MNNLDWAVTCIEQLVETDGFAEVSVSDELEEILSELYFELVERGFECRVVTELGMDLLVVTR